MSEALGIIPTYLRTEQDFNVTRDAIGTYLQTTGGADLMVIDDASPNEEAVKALQDLNRNGDFLLQLNPENKGFAATCNIGMRMARTQKKHALLINADIVFDHDDWYKNMLANPADVVGALLLYPNGLVQHAGIYYSVIMRHFDHIYRLAPAGIQAVQTPRVCPVTGALMLIKYETILKVGLLDENFYMSYEDVSYCHDVFATGLTCVYDPTVVAIHHESLFRFQDRAIKDRMDASWAYLHKKHAGMSFAEYVPTLIWDDE